MDKTTYLLTERCRFHLGDEPDAWQAWYDDTDSSWEDVSLPTTGSVSLPFSKEYSSGTGYLAGGIGWYRIRITPREEWQGKRLSVIFDGVYKNSRVWCNSYYLGMRPNGYISFSYDITEQFSFHHENILCVCVDHRDISDSRWFTGSGITRKVTLVVEDAIHPVYNGICFETPQVNEKEAAFRVSNELINTSETDTEVRITNKLLDKDGIVAASASTVQKLKAGSIDKICTSSSLAAPKLWSPDTPCLYTLVTSLSYARADGELMESVVDTTKVGIRSFFFDPNKGFVLNGVSSIMKGVCLHHDAGCLGAAVTKPVWKRRLQKLKAMGCNAIRMSHNPHMPELYELCDEMGFLAMDEAFDEWEGPKNKWWQGHNVYPPRHQGYYLDFPQWHRQDLTDLIRRDRNHPSIIMWSIGNEIDYPNDPYCHPSFSTMTGNNDANKPAQERQYNPLRPNAERLAVLAANLTAIVKETDTTRPVTLAAAFPELSSGLGFLDSLDVAGFNYKEQLYEESHRAFPNKPLLGSENGHSLSAWKAVTDNDYISGQFLWTGIDYLGEAHGWPIRGSRAGLLTTAGFEKAGYYRRQSFWSDKPMVHLATCLAPEEWDEFTPVSECWNYPLGEKILVKCYTNLPEIELFLNERSLGIYHKDNAQDCISLIVPFEPGTLKAQKTTLTNADEASTAEAAAAISHSLKTVGCACQIALNCWHDEEMSDTSIRQIEAVLLDYDGNRVFSDCTNLEVSVENGRLLGLENGNLADITDYASASRRAYMGQLVIYVVPLTPGQTPIVTVSGKNLKTAQIKLD